MLEAGPYVKFEVPGDIVPWARARRQGHMYFTPKRQADYSRTLRDYAAEQMAGKPVIDGPCELRVCAVYLFPSSYSSKRRLATAGWKAGKPDADNISKIVADSLNGIVWTDDARIAKLDVEKRYGDRACLKVEVAQLG